MCVCVCVCACVLPNLSARAGYDTRSFLSGVKQVWLQSFPSPRLVAIPKLKNPVYPAFYPLLNRKKLDVYLSRGYSWYLKCKQLRFGFELGSTCPTTITDSPWTPPYIHIYIYIYMCVCVCVVDSTVDFNQWRRPAFVSSYAYVLLEILNHLQISI